MNIIFLNIGGIGNIDSRLAFSDMCRLHNWFIAELVLEKEGHGIDDSTWFTILPSTFLADFARDMNELPNYRFP